MAHKSEYQSVYHWKMLNIRDYKTAKQKGYILDICDYFGWQYPEFYWTKENTINEARRYKSCDEWVEKSLHSYSSAVENNWVEECVSHMEGYLKYFSVLFYKRARCIEEARKYKTIYEWEDNSPISYKIALKNKKGWMYACTKHMIVRW